MSLKIAIASGKGGTGKTTVAVNLFSFIKNHVSSKVLLVDCDVEEPNDALFFKGKKEIKQEDINRLIPVIDTGKCTFCRKCSAYCEFNAIVVIPTASFAQVEPGLCHSCGACIMACKDDAITEVPEKIGTIAYFYDKNEGFLVEGRLEVGSAMQTMVIRELKNRIPGESEYIIFDAPPGTSCPVVQTIHDADFVVLVAEPTLFGLNDLKIMLALVKELDKPFGLVINKAGLGDDAIYRYCKDESICILGEIPFSKEYASLYATGDILEKMPEGVSLQYKDIVKQIIAKTHEGSNHC